MKKREQTAVRYRENLSIQPSYTDYIFNQWHPDVEKLAFGTHGHVGREGCGAVAIHNVMKFIGEGQNFCDVLREMEELNMTWLGARFGTKPLSLGRYFRRHKIPYWKYHFPAEFKAALLSHRIGIVNTWNKRLRGMHFYCVYYSREENAFYTANLRTPGTEFEPITPDEISSRRFIVGYIV